MGLFGRGKKKGTADDPQARPNVAAKRPQSDFLSPLWSNWPPASQPSSPAAPPSPPSSAPPPAASPPASAWTATPPPTPYVAPPIVTPPPPAPPPAPPPLPATARVVATPMPPRPASPPTARIVATPMPPRSAPPQLPAAAPQVAPPRRDNPPPVLGPAVVVQRVRNISDAPPPGPLASALAHDPPSPPTRRWYSGPPEAPLPPPPAGPRPPAPAGMPPAPTPVPAADRAHRAMQHAMQHGNFRAARDAARKILRDDPTDLDAVSCLEACVPQLRAACEARLGRRDRVLRQSLPTDWLSNMELDTRVAFLLSRIDGVSTIDEILDVCGMPLDDAMDALVELLDEGVVEAVPTKSSRPPRA